MFLLDSDASPKRRDNNYSGVSGDRDRDPEPELRVATDVQEGDRQRHIASYSRRSRGTAAATKLKARDEYLNRDTR